MLIPNANSFTIGIVSVGEGPNKLKDGLRPQRLDLGPTVHLCSS